MYSDVAFCIRHSLVVCKPDSDASDVHVWRLWAPVGRPPRLAGVASPHCATGPVRAVVTGMSLARRHVRRVMACTHAGHLIVASAAAVGGHVRVGVCAGFADAVVAACLRAALPTAVAVSGFLGGDDLHFWEVSGIACSNSRAAAAHVAVLGQGAVGGAVQVWVFRVAGDGDGDDACTGPPCAPALWVLGVGPAPLFPMGIAFACSPEVVAVLLGDRLLSLHVGSGEVGPVPERPDGPWHRLMRKRMVVSHPTARGAVVALVRDQLLGVPVVGIISAGVGVSAGLPCTPRVARLEAVPGVGFLLMPKAGHGPLQVLVTTAGAHARAATSCWRAAWLGQVAGAHVGPVRMEHATATASWDTQGAVEVQLPTAGDRMGVRAPGSPHTSRVGSHPRQSRPQMTRGPPSLL